MNASMDLQTNIKLWISSSLEKMPRGAKSRLAEHLGITPTQLYKMLNTAAGKEHRVIRADEYVKIAEFLGGAPDDMMPLSSIDESKKLLLSIYDNVSPELQRAILLMVKGLAEEKNKK